MLPPRNLKTRGRSKRAKAVDKSMGRTTSKDLSFFPFPIETDPKCTSSVPSTLSPYTSTISGRLPFIRGQHSPGREAKKMHRAILCTNILLFSEAFSVLFGQNTWKLSDERIPRNSGWNSVQSLADQDRATSLKASGFFSSSRQPNWTRR